MTNTKNENSLDLSPPSRSPCWDWCQSNEWIIVVHVDRLVVWFEPTSLVISNLVLGQICKDTLETWLQKWRQRIDSRSSEGRSRDLMKSNRCSHSLCPSTKQVKKIDSLYQPMQWFLLIRPFSPSFLFKPPPQTAAPKPEWMAFLLERVKNASKLLKDQHRFRLQSCGSWKCWLNSYQSTRAKMDADEGGGGQFWGALWHACSSSVKDWLLYTLRTATNNTNNNNEEEEGVFGVVHLLAWAHRHVTQYKTVNRSFLKQRYTGYNNGWR